MFENWTRKFMSPSSPGVDWHGIVTHLLVVPPVFFPGLRAEQTTMSLCSLLRYGLIPC